MINAPEKEYSVEISGYGRVYNLIAYGRSYKEALTDMESILGPYETMLRITRWLEDENGESYRGPYVRVGV